MPKISLYQSDDYLTKILKEFNFGIKQLKSWEKEIKKPEEVRLLPKPTE